MEPYSFSDELDRNTNSPLNNIQRQVKRYMLTPAYVTYSEIVYPIDRAVNIYMSRYKSLQTFFETIKKQPITGVDAVLQRNSIIMNALAEIYSYLSVQFSLFDLLRNHANSMPSPDELIGEYDRFLNLPITDFFFAYRNNVLHQVNFSTILRFDSERDEAKLVYDTQELRNTCQWKKSEEYLSSVGESITIENSIPEYHSYVYNFLDRYEAIIFGQNTRVFGSVLTTLQDFEKQYTAIGQKGLMPVSGEYIKNKLKLLPDSD